MTRITNSCEVIWHAVGLGDGPPRVEEHVPRMSIVQKTRVTTAQERVVLSDGPPEILPESTCPERRSARGERLEYPKRSDERHQVDGREMF